MLSEQQIKAAAAAIDRVKSLDNTITDLGECVEERADEWGQKTRDIFGRNRLSHFTHSHLGEVIFCAVVNELLKRRQEIIKEHGDIFDFSDPPCPPQVPSDET